MPYGVQQSTQADACPPHVTRLLSQQSRVKTAWQQGKRKQLPIRRPACPVGHAHDKGMKSAKSNCGWPGAPATDGCSIALRAAGI